MSYQVIGYPICPYVHRILIAMNLKNITYSLTFLNPHEDLPAWFKDFSPLMRIPVVTTPSNEVLFESLVILEYLEESVPAPALHPASIIDRAINRAWVEVISMLYVLQHKIITAPDIGRYNTAFDDLDNHLSIVTKGAKENTKFYNNNQFGMTDLVLAPFFFRQSIIAKESGNDLLAAHPRLQSLNYTIMQTPAVLRTITDDLEIQLINNYREHGVFLFNQNEKL